MWKVFPLISLLKIIFLFFSVLLISAILIVIPSESNFLNLTFTNFKSAISLATPVTLIFISLVYILGKWGWLLLWKAPLIGGLLNKYVCPNLNGSWKGKVESSFLGKDGNRTIKAVVLNIKADLFGFNITLDSLDEYQNSKVIQSELFKDKKTGAFYLIYIFESYVPIPKETDDRTFEGSAKLEIYFNDKSTCLKGTYWTNRAWQRGMNTAGLISAVKE